MKHLFRAVLALCFVSSAFPDEQGNNLTFAPRQDSSEMTVTSVNLTPGGGTITATGEWGSTAGYIQLTN